MGMSRRDLVKTPLALAGASMLNLAPAVGMAQPQFQSNAAGAEVIDLWPHPPAGALHPGMSETVEETSQEPAYRSRRLKGVSKPCLQVFPAANPNGAAMLVIPGGGFAWNYFDHEGYNPAAILNRAGITCFVLFYRLPQDGWSDPANVALADAQRAMRVIRANSARLRIESARVGVMGFSAGGFLTATLATRHHVPFYAPVDATDRLDARPLCAAPIYPVQTLDPAFAYVDTAPSLFGRKQATVAQVKAFSPEANVTPAAAPTFLVHAEDDGLVPVANTTRLRDALVAQKITVETHLFSRGGHGFGMRPEEGRPGGLWAPLLLNFAREQKLYA